MEVRTSPGTPSPWQGERAIVTTPWHDTPQACAHAQALAAWFACAYVPRRRRSIARLCEEEAASVVIVAETMPKLYHARAPEEPLFFHPGTAQTRLVAVDRGQGDRLLRVARVRPGDVVVDATLGRGLDALVLAAGVGPHGRVIGLESSWALYRLFAYAKAHPGGAFPHLRALWPRIEPVWAEHTAWLARQPADSVDVVYFDPMFQRPLVGGTSIDAARAFTNPSPLAAAAFAEAQRVARRCVVVKERPQSTVWEQLGLVPDKPRAPFAFGVWWKEAVE
ncbi:hypothetical protein GCM10010885_11970 [Alicyclobacillus cellulosilyticus]|uniref:SAM-dependent methyltransferase n=1 Tax=Alicyclobacillus cellulosilyticus TaxID=1003997 RepID=A0A917NJ31_9BACL|nr:class I SAM-dependent methyltransferase [Alicyclobacillus cellulosilyticus]GGJ04306.1 hypothetical protein GCM10010885_11970 [Alicyclobacillus cellulosilyticus]